MTQEKNIVDIARPHIFEQEAAGLLSDLMGCPEIGMPMLLSDEKGLRKAKDYIVGVLNECYTLGHLKLAAICNGTDTDADEILAYALLFQRPGYSDTCYCHKIYVYEQHRGQGIGSQLLSDLMAQFKGMGLVCLPDKVPFYTRAGMKTLGALPIPDDELFRLTRYVYIGLNMMVYGEMPKNEIPVFMLNDKDIKTIIKLLHE